MLCLFLVVLSWSERMKQMKQKMTMLASDTFINLNLFPRRVFGNHTDQITAKYHGKLATRLYLVLLISSFTILTLYTISQKQIMTKEFNKPSFETYKQLIQNYGDQLKCSCSSISSTYGQFIKIEPVFHEICSSSFVSDEVVDGFEFNTLSNIVFGKKDYRNLMLPHLQYLRGLCQLSNQSINSSIEQLLSTSFVSKDLLFENGFDKQIDDLIEQTKQNAPANLNAIFFLIRNINFGNAIVSTRGTNFYYLYELGMQIGNLMSAETEIYDNDCSCALHLNCTSQAYFSTMIFFEKAPIKGLRIGCILTESLLSSTLECFYDSSCVSMIKEYMYYTHPLQPLSTTKTNQSQIHLSIGDLVKNLFIDRWITTKNYSSYYQQCSPQLCSYSYIEQVNLVYIASFLLGFYGGLSIVLQWICPRVIQFMVAIKRNLKKHSNIVHPGHCPEAVSTEIGNRNMSNTTNKLELKIVPSTSQHLRLILTCLVIMVLIVLLTIFSIYIVQHRTDSITKVTSMFFLLYYLMFLDFFSK